MELAILEIRCWYKGESSDTLKEFEPEELFAMVINTANKFHRIEATKFAPDHRINRFMGASPVAPNQWWEITQFPASIRPPLLKSGISIHQIYEKVVQ